MAKFAETGIEIRKILLKKPDLTEPIEPTYDIEISSEKEGQKQIAVYVDKINELDAKKIT